MLRIIIVLLVVVVVVKEEEEEERVVSLLLRSMVDLFLIVVVVAGVVVVVVNETSLGTAMPLLLLLVTVACWRSPMSITRTTTAKTNPVTTRINDQEQEEQEKDGEKEDGEGCHRCWRCGFDNDDNDNADIDTDTDSDNAFYIRLQLGRVDDKGKQDIVLLLGASLETAGFDVCDDCVWRTVRFRSDWEQI